MTPAGRSSPDPQLFWRWVWSAVRPALGWALAGAGGLLIVLGWFGVSGAVLPSRQLPYLVSGGLGGLGLVVVGAVLLAGQDVRRELARLDRLEERVAELVALLTEPGAGSEAAESGGGAGPAVAPSQLPSPRDGPGFVRAPRGVSLHRADCPLVAGKPDLRPADPADGRAGRLRPCRVCDPLPNRPRAAPA